MLKLSKKDAVAHEREGVNALYYQLPEINAGTTVAYAEFTKEHGERAIGEKARIYYILAGEGEFIVNGETFSVAEGDVIPIPSHATYSLFPKSNLLKVLLVMELLDVSKLPQK